MTHTSGPGLSPDLLGGAPEGFVQTALIAGGIGLWEWHLATGDMILSPHLEALLGYPTRGFDGASQTFLGRLLPADRVRVEAAVGAVAASGNETDLEFRVIDVGGIGRWFNARGRVLRDAVGQPIRLVGTMQEIPATVVTERRMRRQQAGLLQLLADDRITQLPVDEAFRCITEVAGRTLEIERTSVWLFDESRTNIRCHNLYRRSLRQHMAGASLEAGAYPAYFRALESGRAVAASDAHRDPRTIELAADYLAPLGIGAMLEAPIRHDGRLVGVVCHEHVGPARQWLLDEKSYAASIADLVTMALDAGERARLADRLAQSEERYRTFVSLSTEGILRVEISPPVSLEAALEEQVAHIRRHGVVAEANASLAKLLGASSPQRLVGRTLESLVRPEATERVLTEWIRAGYRFSEYEIDLVGFDGATLWLLGSMIGVTTDGQLVALWSTWRNITRRKEAVQALEFQARHDPLTGLPNRKWLAERLGAALEVARTTGASLALMMMDLDHFKEINDSLGHFAGDQLLKLIGPRLQPLLAARGGELARLGGDEFAVILSGCRDAAAAAAIAHEVITSLREPFEVGQLKLGIDASVGASLAPTHGLDASTLMRCADVAMYEAKRKGLHATVYDAALDRYSPRRLALANALGEAVRNGELYVEYQPIARIADRSVVAVEALARWRHPQYGEVAPDEFIPLAEMGDHIRGLTLKVLAERGRPVARMARARAAPADRGQPVDAGADRPGLRRRDAPDPEAARRAGRGDRLRDHRERDGHRPAARARDDRAPARPRHRLQRRRLRHRVLVALVSQAAAARSAQDRPLVRRRDDDQRPRRLDRPLDDQPRPRPRTAGRGRGGRNRRCAGDDPAARLRRGAGASHRPAGRGCGHRGLARAGRLAVGEYSPGPGRAAVPAHARSLLAAPGSEA